jgi:hypothetical protein
MDLARRITGQEGLPQRVMSLGGHFVVDDVATTPNTQLAAYDFGDGVPFLFESRGLPAQPGVNYMDPFRSMRGPNGLAVLCEGGYYSGYTGGAAYSYDGKQIQRFPGDGGGGHMPNFLAAVRSRRAQDLAAPIATGHISTALCHLGNLSHRLGGTAELATAQTAIEKIPDALDALAGMQKHLEVHGVDLNRQLLTLGPWIQVDAAAENIAAVEGGDEGALEHARFLLKETQRSPWAIPDQV